MTKLQNFYLRSFLFIVLSMAAAVINYLLYPFLARILNLRELGDYITIIGLSNQVMGILLAFSVISIALVKQHDSDTAEGKAAIIQKFLLWLFLLLSVVVLSVSPLLQQLLKIQNSLYFVLLSFVMILAVPGNIWTGYLQGHKEQIRVGIYGLCSAAFKLACVIGLAAPFGVSGGLWGFIIGTFLGLGVLYILPGQNVPSLKNLFKPFHELEKKFLMSQRTYVAQAIFVVGSLVFLQNYDLILAKASFSPAAAGLYGGISVFSNALYFTAFLLIWILLPEFSTKNPSNNRRVLRTAYKIICLLTGMVVIGGLALGNTVLELLLGSQFGNLQNTLVVASLYQICLAAVALYAFYLLVMRQARSVLLAGLVLISCLTVPLFFRSNSFTMICALLGAAIIGLGSYVILAVFGSGLRLKDTAPDH